MAEEIVCQGDKVTPQFTKSDQDNCRLIGLLMMIAITQDEFFKGIEKISREALDSKSDSLSKEVVTRLAALLFTSRDMFPQQCRFIKAIRNLAKEIGLQMEIEEILGSKLVH